MAARTVPTMPDWTLNEEITSSLLNQITTYSRFWSSPPMFSMYQGVAQPLATGTDTQITCDTSEYDTDSGRAAGTPWSYVIPVGMTGRWTFTVYISYAANSTGARAAKIFRNGAQQNGAYVSLQAAPSPVASAVGLTRTFACSAGDVISAIGNQTSGGSLNTFVTGSIPSFFEGRLHSLASP